MPPAIRVDQISKRYRIDKSEKRVPYRTLRDDLSRLLKTPARWVRKGFRSAPREDFWALQDVSFEVQPGEVVGIIGRNGAGKSTLLKVISRIIGPTSGRIELRGRVGSLLEIGTGFHPELTGRENIFLSGAILGMSRQEIRQKFDQIVEFSDIERFLDTPAKRYSSGMYMRLAFAVAAHLDPEILLVDEVLAVGDSAFQKKCLGKMNDVAKSGRTVLFVSHNLEAVRTLCRVGVVLHQGAVRYAGCTHEAIACYQSLATATRTFRREAHQHNDDDSRPVQLLSVTSSDLSGVQKTDFAADEQFSIELQYRVLHSSKNLRIGILITNRDQVAVFTTCDTDPDGFGTERTPGVHTSRCVIPSSMLSPGTYSATVAADAPMQEIFFFERDALSFSVNEQGAVGAAIGDGRRGVIRPNLEWFVN